MRVHYCDARDPYIGVGNVHTLWRKVVIKLTISKDFVCRRILLSNLLHVRQPLESTADFDSWEWFVQFNFLRIEETLPIRVFVCFCCFFVVVFCPFHSFGDVADERLQNLNYTINYTRHSWPLSEGYFMCHTYYDTVQPFIKVISKEPWHFLAVELS